MTDFPRLQIAVALAATLVLHTLLYGISWGFETLFPIALLLALGYQLFRIFPYLPVAPKQALRASSVDRNRSIRLLISNVLMENRRSDDLLKLIAETDPDLVRGRDERMVG